MCARGGYYPLGPLSVTAGDIFGLYERTSTYEATAHVIVYPRLYELRDMGLPPRFFLGDTRRSSAHLRIRPAPSRFASAFRGTVSGGSTGRLRRGALSRTATARRS